MNKLSHVGGWIKKHKISTKSVENNLIDEKVTILLNRVVYYKHLTAIILTILVLVGGYLRLDNAIKFTNFYGDSARDLLVARHIASYGEKITVGHSASGFGQIFYYPPYYYYLLALLYKIVPTAEFFVIFFAVLDTISILLVFLIGKEIIDQRTGLISAVFYSLSAHFILNQIGAVNFAAPLFWISYWLFLRSLKKKEILLFSISFGVLLLSSTITYSAIIFIPYYLIIMFYIYKYRINKILLTLTAALLLVAIWYSPLLFTFNIQMLFARMSPLRVLTFSYNLPIIFFTNTIALVSELFLKKKVYILSIFPIFAFLFIAPNLRKKFFYIITPVIYLLVFASVKSGEIYPWWFLISEPFILISLGFGVVSLWQAKQQILAIASVVILVHLLFQGYYCQHWGNSLIHAKQIAKEIILASKTIEIQQKYKNNNFFQVVLSTATEDSWHTTTLLYWLEVLTNKKFVKLENRDESVIQVNKDNYVFWFCLDYADENTKRSCFNKYIKSKNQYYLVNTMPIREGPYFGYILKNIEY
jgi:4-amino-4-deoxy-L-arabinose transferase-like glycosyltransferase